MNEPMVARVAVDMPLAHLDRFFDYRVPDAMADVALPGCRVRVRFAGRLRDGFVIARVAASDSDRELLPLQRVVSPEPVLKPEIVKVVRAVADHCAGTFSDVVRLAVPPRHGITETAQRPPYPEPDLGTTSAATLTEYPLGQPLLAALADGRAPRAALSLSPVSAPAGSWTAAMVEAAAATLRGGRGVLLLVPDAADLERLASLCAAVFGKGSFVTLTADVGPAARYRAFLAAARGQVRLVLGTRAAAFAPVQNLGLIAMFDDGDDSYADPRSPYPHSRDVVALRAARQRSALLYLGYARTAEVQALVTRGWLVSVEAPAVDRRELCPVVRVAADTDLSLARDPAARTRLPHEVFIAIRAALAAGPVLIQVPRRGYLVSVSCQSCRAPAGCPSCQHPLAATPGADGALKLSCQHCGPIEDWRCAECGGTGLRAPTVGVDRTAEEIGRAFPEVKVLRSSGDHQLSTVAADAALVLATPGSEPDAVGGYAAAVLLDTVQMLSRPGLRAGEESLRRWFAVVAKVRPAEQGGTVVVVGDPAARAVQALIRLDSVGFAERELADRINAGFPPAAKLVVIDGPVAAVADASRRIAQSVKVDVLGPLPAGKDGESTVTLRTPLSTGKELVAAAAECQAHRAAHKAEGSLRVRVDPQVLE